MAASLGHPLRRRFDHGAGQACAPRAPKLGAAMTEAITQAAARAAFARRNGDEATEAYWTERVLILSDQEHRCAAFDELKGSPDHSGASALIQSIRAKAATLPDGPL